MSRKKTLWDHYLDAVRLLSRADVHLEYYQKLMEGKGEAELTGNLRADIAVYLKSRVPSV